VRLSAREPAAVTRRTLESSARVADGHAFLLSGLTRFPPAGGASRGRGPVAASRFLFEGDATERDALVVALVLHVARLPDVAAQDLRLVVGRERQRAAKK
jgi:hypothetical protein